MVFQTAQVIHIKRGKKKGWSQNTSQQYSMPDEKVCKIQRTSFRNLRVTYSCSFLGNGTG